MPQFQSSRKEYLTEKKIDLDWTIDKNIDIKLETKLAWEMKKTYECISIMFCDKVYVIYKHIVKLLPRIYKPSRSNESITYAIDS